MELLRYTLSNEELLFVSASIFTCFYFILFLVLAGYKHYNYKDKNRNLYLLCSFCSPLFGIFTLPILMLLLITFILVGLPYYLFITLVPRRKQKENL